MTKIGGNRESDLKNNFIVTYVALNKSMGKREQSIEFYNHVYRSLKMEDMMGIVTMSGYVQDKTLSEVRQRFYKNLNNQTIEEKIAFRDYFYTKYKDEIREVYNKEVEVIRSM